VLGNDDPQASVAGEIVPCKEFYDYDAKYLVEGSEAVIPAKLTKAEMKTVQRLAIAAFQAVDCTGLARVDFLMDPKSRKIFVNEINTMPGFTAISMYPKMWVASGVSYPELIDRLIHLGIERHETRSGISTAGEWYYFPRGGFRLRSEFCVGRPNRGTSRAALRPGPHHSLDHHPVLFCPAHQRR
jgi:D-alanine-D-alanine ligase